MLNNTIDKTVEILQVLTDKLSGINDKAKENTLLASEYEDLNNKLNTLSAMFNSSSESDIVSLLNLPRPISEYTNDHIREIISIPYTDESGKISLNEGCIEFEVVGVNHHKDINDETKPTITLMPKNIIRFAAFDAKEPNNPMYDGMMGETMRASYGNNRWAVSNIRQWLNSSGAANEWFTAQHEYDAAPTADNVNGEYGAYANDPGFLAGFSDEIKQHFATVRNKTFLCEADKSALSKDFEETEDKVFLPSYTEMGFRNINSNKPEGSHLDKKFIDDNSRIKSSTDGLNSFYWMRTIPSETQHDVFRIYNDEGIFAQSDAAYSGCGITPIIVLC